MSKVQTSTILREAKSLIRSPKAWARGTLARDSEGRSLDPTEDSSKSACEWCATGALLQAAVDEGVLSDVTYNSAVIALDKAASELYGTNPVSVNDNVNYNLKDVHHIYDRAIEIAESEYDENVQIDEKRIIEAIRAVLV